MERNNISEDDLNILREQIRPYLTEKRYAHTLSVEREAAYLASVYLPESEIPLRAAALLHDIAKKLCYEKQLKYIYDFDIIKKSEETLPSPSVMHSAAAPAVIMSEFPMFARQDILSAVRYHTTGRAGMTVFDAIIYISDYIEPERRYEDSIKLRTRLHNGLSGAVSQSEKLALLEAAVLTSLRNTIAHINGMGYRLDDETRLAEEYFSQGGHLC